MSAGAEHLLSSELTPLRGVELLRTLHKILPLGRKYHPLLSSLNPRHGLLEVPFGQYRVVQPAAWAKQNATLLLVGAAMVPEFVLLEPLCRQATAGQVIDVGANIGAYTLLIRALTPLPIVAYEPEPFVYRLLQANIARNKLANVEARNVACGAARGKISFSLGINGSVAVNADAAPAPAAGPQELAMEDVDAAAARSRAGRAQITVPVTTLDDDFAGMPVALLKIDCEGFECHILRGARRLLEEQRPPVFVEVHPADIGRYGGSVPEILALLEPHYELEFWDFNFAHIESRLMRSVLKHRDTRGLRFATAAEFLAVACHTPPPRQALHLLGRPKKHRGGF